MKTKKKKVQVIEEEVIEEEKIELPKRKKKEQKQEEEKIEKEEVKLPKEQFTEVKVSKSDLVELYVLNFELPSWSSSKLLTELKLEKWILEKLDQFDKNLYNAIEALRQSFYRDVRKVFHSSVLGWVAVSKDAEEIVQKYKEEVSKILIDLAENYVTKMMEKVHDQRLKQAYALLKEKLLEKAKRKYVRILKVYLEPEDAIQILSEIIERIKKEKEEIEKKLKEAEEKKKKRAIYNYRHELKVITEKLKKFEEFLKMIKS